MSGRADGLNDIFDHSIKVVEDMNSDGGTVQHTPTQDKDIANKKYVDDEVAGGVGGFAANTIVVLDGVVSTLNGNVLILV